MASEQSSTVGNLTTIVVPSPAQFDEILAAHVNDQHLFVLVSGEKDAAAGKSWCPDCVSAEPVIHEALSGIDGPVTLLYCPVVRAEYKGNPQYPYRTHSQLKLKAVPTLYRWNNKGKPARSLVENECLDTDLMQALLE